MWWVKGRFSEQKRHRSNILWCSFRSRTFVLKIPSPTVSKPPPPPLILRSQPLSPKRVWICVNYGNQLRDDVRGMWLKALWLFKEIKKNGACVIRSATSHLALVRARIFTLDLLRIILCEYIIGGLCLIISYLNRLHIRLFWHGNFLPSWEYLFIV